MPKRKPADKAFELVSLGRASYASHSAIDRLLKEVREHGIPETFDRSAQYRARLEVCSTLTPYGTLTSTAQAPLSKGGHQPITFQNPLAFFHYNCRHSESFSKIVDAALDRHPPSPSKPWSIIIYEDGVDPSDGLSKNHSRMSGVVYWAFAEYGLQALACEQMWGTITVCRNTEYKQLAGGMSQLFNQVLKLFFGKVHHLRRSGISVTLHNGREALIIGRASILLADIPALKECIECKGHAGTLCCPLCINAVQHKAPGGAIPLHLLSEDAVSISCSDFEAFKKHDDLSICKVAQKLDYYRGELVAERMTNVDFQERQQVLGYNWSPSGVILQKDYDLGISSMLMFDWAHVFVHDGLCDNELGMCMKALHSRRSQTSYKELGEYISHFTFPKNAPDPTHLFTAAANANNSRKESFTCSGSEFLTIAPVVYRYFSRVVAARDELNSHVNSLLACLGVLLLVMAVRTGTVSASDLSEAICEHFKLFVLCYGEEKVKPKHHYARHLPAMLAYFGFLLATFTHERKHRLVTRYTRDRKNLRNWDASTIQEITCHQLWELQQNFFHDCSTASPKGRIKHLLMDVFPGVACEDIVLLNNISANGGRAHTGDVVSYLIDNEVRLGELLLCVDVQGAKAAFVALWLPDTTCTDIDWRKFAVSSDEVVQVPLESLDTIFTYRMSTTRKSCAVFFPLEVRPK